jgi:competence protein ComEC
MNYKEVFLEKLNLIESKKEWIYFLLFFTIVIFINFCYEFYLYKNFTDKKIQKVEVTIINQYQKTSKKGKPYYVLKCKNSNMTFFTTSWKKELANFQNSKISIKVITKNISFFDYLKGFFAPTFGIKLIDSKSYKNDFSDYIKNQHENIYLQEFFSAIFLATPISKDFRELSNIWGISHIIAISGFHLGIITSVIYFVLLYPYKSLQQRFFPYNNRKVTILYITIFILFCYLYFLDFVPSLFRSFIMYCIAVFLLTRHISIFSFYTLLVTVLIAISIFPKILFSLGFWLSISGVFYIYLYIQYFRHINKYLSFFMFNFFIFLAMLPIVHNFFPIFSFYQLLSPVLTIAFSVFYPVEIILHVFGIGGFFDDFLLPLLQIKREYVEVYINFYLFLFYILLSFVSIYYKKAFIALNIFMLGFFIYLLYYV